MFYIKTADPLNAYRYLVNKMEGGITYLKNVVVNDSLGIAAELEAEMQNLVDNYVCEWKEVVDNPALQSAVHPLCKCSRKKKIPPYSLMKCANKKKHGMEVICN